MLGNSPSSSYNKLEITRESLKYRETIYKLQQVIMATVLNVNKHCLLQREIIYIIPYKERRHFKMLKENIKQLRKSKGLSQEELAIKLNVVRQTVSKWEQGLSVPDSEMLIRISEIFETPVSSLLKESILECKADDIKAISEKLEIINLQLSQRKNDRRKLLRRFFILLCVMIILGFIILFLLNSPYQNWDYNKIEWAVTGVIYNSFEWLFVRIAPIIFIISIIGIALTSKKR